MALPATNVFEVRTTGSDTANGGAFDPSVTSPGVDFSQQDSAAVSYTDLVIGATTTNLTSAAHPFGATHVGNTVQITGGTGFTTGFYSVRSVSGAVATMDRAVGTAASTGGVGGLGGALATLGKATGAMVAQNRVYIKQGAYTQSATPTLAAAGVFPSATSKPNRITGYATTRGDNPTGATRPTITASGTTATLLPVTTSGWVIENLILDCAGVASVGVSFSGSAYSTVRAVAVLNFKQFGINGGPSGTQHWLNVTACEITGGTAAATAAITQAQPTPSGLRVIGCYIHDNACTGISVTDIAATIVGNVLANNTGASSDGIALTWGSLVVNNTIYGSGRHGVSISNANGGPYVINQSITNNIIANNGGYGLSTLSGTITAEPLFDGNAYYSNTSGTRNNVGTGTLDVLLTADPFVNAAGGNFDLNSVGDAFGQTTGLTGVLAGRYLRGAGLGTFPGLPNTVGYPDIGAVQSPAAGGLRRVTMTGGITG